MSRIRLAAFALVASALGCKGNSGPAGEAAQGFSSQASNKAPSTAAEAVGSTETTAAAQEPPPMTKSGTRLTFYGHAAFKLETPQHKVLWVDPWLQNPKNPTGKNDLAAVDKGDLVLVTHGHFDHIGDAAEIGKKTKAKLVTTFDLGRSIVKYANYPKTQVSFETQGNFGGTIALLDGEVNVTFVPAVHSSAVSQPDAKGEGEVHDGGNPGGFIISVKNGPVIYHTGDTDLFADMSLIPAFNKVTVMLTCIGDHFVMGPARAAEAVKRVSPAMVVPMHYGTFPVLTGTAEAFDQALTERGSKSQLKVMQVHETIDL